MDQLDVDRLISKLEHFDALRDTDTINRGKVERIRPAHASEWPEQLHDAVHGALTKAGVPNPYQHQADAIVKALSGADVVMESPTASGKTLAFVAPMLHLLKETPGSHAMMIYPMKALAFDQREQVRQICQPLGIESWPYDGDTDGSDLSDSNNAWSNEQSGSVKALIRQQPPHIILTNPEYLNMSFLGSRESWEKHELGARFLRNLRFVVIDEIHEYRGFFGSNMALLLRRFFRHLNRIGAHPQVFLATATCANPKEHAESLTGRQVEVISARAVLRPERHFIFVNPEIPDYQYRDILRLRVEQAALTVLAEGLQVLVFCPTKRFLELAFSNSKRKASELGLEPDHITAFHADLKPEARQRIQQRIKSGEIKVTFTTNALEIGLDVGGLDGVILAGFPSNIMSAWQQIGRAGRAWNQDSFVLFYSMNDPIDRFFVGNLGAFLDKPFDELVVDPANEELINRHLPSLVEETGGALMPPEEMILGSAFSSAIKGNVATLPKGLKPQQHLNLRGGIGQSYELKRHNEEIGQISAMRRFREAYIGAIFPFFGQRYVVRSHEEQAVVLDETDAHLRTEPGFFTVITKSEFYDGFGFGDLEVYYGSISIVMNFTGYKLVDERSGDVVRTGGDNDALYLNNLHSCWFDLPSNSTTIDGIGAVEHMIRVGSMFVIPADRFDTSTYSKTGNELGMFYYENYPGGIGVAKKLFSVWHAALEKGLEVAQSCKCSSGCQNCIEPAKSWDISNASIDKVKGIELAEKLLKAQRRGADKRFQGGLMLPT